jgi:hypothetical protein
MVRMEGRSKTCSSSCVLSEDADKLLEYSFVWRRAAALHVWDVKPRLSIDQ